MRKLEAHEIDELERDIWSELQDNLTIILTKLNRMGELEKALKLWGLDHLIEHDEYDSFFKTGKIIVVGQSDVRKNELLSVAKSVGIDKNRIELYLNYEDASKTDFRKYQWDSLCSVIMVGPMDHSGISKGDYSSIITALESTDGYPPVRRMGSNALKITKSNFRTTLEELIDEGVIVK